MRQDYHKQLCSAGLGLESGQLELLAGYLKLVGRYNRSAGLTAVPEAEYAAELGAQSLRLLEPGDIADGCSVADLGSGNGTPVVPLAICRPGAWFTGIDARHKRCTFLRLVAAALKIPNLRVVNARVETLFPSGRRFDMVVSRAFAPPRMFLEFALQLVKPGGEVRGYAGDDCGEVAEAASQLGLEGVNFVEYPYKTRRRHVWSVLVPPESDATCN